MPFRSLMPFGWSSTPAGQPSEQDPFLTLHRDVNRLFEDMFRGFGLPMTGFATGTSPRIDVSETDQALVITAELPGVEQNDLDVQLSDTALTIKGEKKVERDEKSAGLHMRERSYGAFTRTIPLPVEIEQDKVDAKFVNGVLTITLPKSPEATSRTRSVEIKTG